MNAPARSDHLQPTDEPRRLSVGALRGIVGFHVARAAVTTYNGFERHIGRPFNLRKAEFSLLVILLSNDDVSPKPLARLLSVTAPQLTQLLDRLQARGLLTREPNPLDGRSQLIVLTEDGRTLAMAARAAAVPMEADWSTRLSPAEHAMLIELLAKLAGKPNA
jgi:DNA-binding MarR family transcriptional regulator